MLLRRILGLYTLVRCSGWLHRPIINIRRGWAPRPMRIDLSLLSFSESTCLFTKEGTRIPHAPFKALPFIFPIKKVPKRRIYHSLERCIDLQKNVMPSKKMQFKISRLRNFITKISRKNPSSFLQKEYKTILRILWRKTAGSSLNFKKLELITKKEYNKRGEEQSLEIESFKYGTAWEWTNEIESIVNLERLLPTA